MFTIAWAKGVGSTTRQSQRALTGTFTHNSVTAHELGYGTPVRAAQRCGCTMQMDGDQPPEVTMTEVLDQIERVVQHLNQQQLRVTAQLRALLGKTVQFGDETWYESSQRSIV